MKFSDVLQAEGFLQRDAGIHPAPDAAELIHKALPERPEPILFFAKIGFLCVQRHKGALLCALASARVRCCCLASKDILSSCKA